MNCICYYESDDEQKSNISLLANRLGAGFVSKHEILFSDGDKLLVTAEKAEKIFAANSNNCIIIFSENAKFHTLEIAAKKAAVIVPHHIARDLKIHQSFPLITCGCSDKATLSYSSRTDDRIMISLQRCLTSFGGSTIEPFEQLTEAKPSEDAYLIMAACAAQLLLNEKISSHTKEKISHNSITVP